LLKIKHKSQDHPNFSSELDISTEICDMLVEISNKVITTELFDKHFVCDLAACKGACCVKGDSGAPLTLEEVDQMEQDLELYKPYMRPEGITAIEKSGVFYIDQDNEPASTLVNGEECAFVYFDDNNTAKCAIEKAHAEGKTQWKKPLSCHLYPIRTKEFETLTAINYDVWDICEPACSCGDKLAVPVYKFLKEPIIRAFGEDFFTELDQVAKQWAEEKKES
jgi:hypothetical protein